MPGNVREAAAHILSATEVGGFADPLIDKALRERGLSNTRDSGLLTELVMGVLRNRALLDHIAGRYVRKGTGIPDEYVRNSIRLGIYQLLFLSRIPDHAAINETVEAVKRKRGAAVAGFVNGLLRNCARDHDGNDMDGVWEGLPPEIRWSVPKWMIEELERYSGPKDYDLIPMMSSKPPLYVRGNPLKGDEKEVESALDTFAERVTRHPGVTDCYSIEGAGPLYSFPPFVDGYVTPQDSGGILLSRAVGKIARTQAGGKGSLLDACAAPGIKTSYLSHLLKGWDITSSDISPGRIGDMRKNFTRLGVDGVRIVEADFTAGLPGGFEGAFDAVFVDAPCSGLGVMRRNPESKWRVTKGDIRIHAERARKIAENALYCLKGGGLLLYSTCTFTGMENEGVVKSLSDRRGCVVESVGELLPELPGELIRNEFLATVPHILNSDFFFLAALRKV